MLPDATSSVAGSWKQEVNQQIYWTEQAIVCQQVNAAPNPLAKEELNLLARLMGGLEVQKAGNADSGFRVNLFATDEEEEWVSWYVLLTLKSQKWN